MSKKAMKENVTQTYQFILRLGEAGGIDIHKETFKVAACHVNRQPEERVFGTFTKDIYAMRDFLVEQGIKHVITESTGVYWKPMYRILSESRLNVSMVNPAQDKADTDGKD